jgi:hypothetical protein
MTFDIIKLLKNGLTKHGRARDNKFLVTHPITDQRLKLFNDLTKFNFVFELAHPTVMAGIHMTVAGTIAHATYLHVYTHGMTVSATQVDSTMSDLLACNLKEGKRGATKPACVLKT